MTTATIEFVRIHRTCIAAPYQWDAWTQDGTHYYIRHRHGRGQIEGPRSVHTMVGDLPSCSPDKELAHLLDACSRNGTLFAIKRGTVEVDMTDGPEPKVISERPTPAFTGRVALFLPEDGSAVLALRPDGSDQDIVRAFPVGMMKLMKRFFGDMIPAEITGEKE